MCQRSGDCTKPGPAFWAAFRSVPTALCSASISSVIGLVLTPLLVGLLLQTHGGASLNGVGSIALHLLLPFLTGQVLQSRVAAWMQRHGHRVMLVDRASILLMVYGVFSAATLSGMWSPVPASSLLVVAIVDGPLLATSGHGLAARRLGFPLSPAEALGRIRK